MEKFGQMLASFPTNKLLILRFIILKMWENCNIKQTNIIDNPTKKLQKVTCNFVNMWEDLGFDCACFDVNLRE